MFDIENRNNNLRTFTSIDLKNVQFDDHFLVKIVKTGTGGPLLHGVDLSIMGYLSMRSVFVI